jgi:hypothetical protein
MIRSFKHPPAVLRRAGHCTYRAIYRVDDDRTGQWSLPVSVSVPA